MISLSAFSFYFEQNLREIIICLVGNLLLVLKGKFKWKYNFISHSCKYVSLSLPHLSLMIHISTFKFRTSAFQISIQVKKNTYFFLSPERKLKKKPAKRVPHWFQRKSVYGEIQLKSPKTLLLTL